MLIICLKFKKIILTQKTDNEKQTKIEIRLERTEKYNLYNRVHFFAVVI